MTGAPPTALPTVVFLMGPTAAGKSRLALALAALLPVELISVDSAQVYRGMDIGTAKPSAAEQVAVPHHLLDIRDPAQPYSAADFCHDALAAIRAVHSRGRVPILVGGTMLYFRALRDGLADLPRADPAVRAQIAAVAAADGAQGLHAWLARVDAVAAQRLHPNDRQRVQRALEVFLVSGRRLSELQQARPLALAAQVPCRLVQLAVGPRVRRDLDAAIADRIEHMLGAGFIDEVRALRARGDLGPDLPALKAVGYRQAWSFVDGHCDGVQMVAAIDAATRGLAKRQYTWLSGWPDLHRLYEPRPEDVARLISP